jgi:hypothetical protein
LLGVKDVKNYDGYRIDRHSCASEQGGIHPAATAGFLRAGFNLNQSAG